MAAAEAKADETYDKIERRKMKLAEKPKSTTQGNHLHEPNLGDESEN
jgi:hypothetical protein